MHFHATHTYMIAVIFIIHTYINVNLCIHDVHMLLKRLQSSSAFLRLQDVKMNEVFEEDNFSIKM